MKCEAEGQHLHGTKIQLLLVSLQHKCVMS